MQWIILLIKISKAQALAKQYVSIIRLFNHSGITVDNDFNLPRVKKQLQAEFGIAQDGFIEVEGHTYTRHDVMEELDRPDFMKRLTFHKQIWDSPEVLDLLENSAIDLDTFGEAFKPFCGNSEFDEFFSPYFGGSFFYLSRTLLADNSLAEMGHLLSYEEFLLPAEREEAFRPIRLFFDENLKTLRNISDENYKLMRPKISHWIEKAWHTFFNNLPHEFYEAKAEVATMLVNIGVAVQKTHRRDCRQVSEQLILLQDMPESLRGTIVSNHAVYSKSGGSKVSWGGGGFGVFWLIFLLVRIVASSDGCNDRRTPNYQYTPANLQYQIEKFKLPEPTHIPKDSNFIVNPMPK